MPRRKEIDETPVEIDGFVINPVTGELIGEINLEGAVPRLAAALRDDQTAIKAWEQAESLHKQALFRILRDTHQWAIPTPAGLVKMMSRTTRRASSTDSELERIAERFNLGRLDLFRILRCAKEFDVTKLEALASESPEGHPIRDVVSSMISSQDAYWVQLMPIRRDPPTMTRMEDAS